MAERLSRLFGPAALSTDVTAPTTLFTVPSKKTYIVRLVNGIASTSGGGSTLGSVILGITNVTDPDNWLCGFAVESEGTGVATGQLDVAIPVNETEALVGYYTDATGGAHRLDYTGAANDNVWDVTSTTDTDTYGAGAFTPSLPETPCNVYFPIVNTKASSPDVVSGMADNHTSGGVVSFGSIASVANSTQRVSLWGGYLDSLPTDSAVYGLSFGATQTSCRVKAVAIAGSTLKVGTPSTNDVIIQSTTNTVSSGTALGVTQTPTGTNSFQILICVGNHSGTIAGPSGSIELADSALATPTSTAAAYFIYPAQTNPSATASGAVTEGTILCVEIEGNPSPSLTVAGIVID